MEAPYPDDMEERLVQEEYKIWKKNTPFLYDLVITHALEWPSLTVQWLPERDECDNGHAKQKMILGTHTSDNEQNYLMVAEVQLPLEDTTFDARAYDEETQQVGGFGAAPATYIKVVQQINHDGEVNKARYMPQNKFIIATKSPKADVLVFDYSKHPSKPDARGGCKPDLRLLGHDTEGYGLAWAPHKAGYLLSGSDDKKICLWDVGSPLVSASQMQPTSVFQAHQSAVEDVAWHGHHQDVFGSVGDDKQLLVWDMRDGNKGPCQRVKPHEKEINSIAFSPLNPCVLATASADQTVVLHDLRKLTTKLHVLDAHTSDVMQLAWSPHNETILASAGTDRRVMVWDLSRIGDEQPPEEAEDGPPELLFSHGGHTSKISDFSWNSQSQWMMASVADDNILQIWQMAEDIYADPIDDKAA